MYFGVEHGEIVLIEKKWIVSWVECALLFISVSMAASCARNLTSGHLSKNGTVTVNVSKKTSIGETTDVVLQIAAGSVGSMSSSCTIYWGNISEGPDGSQPLCLTIGKETVINGWLLCVSLPPDPYEINPLVNQARLLNWGEGELISGLPSGRTIVVNDIGDLTAGKTEEDVATFAMFDVEGNSLGAPIGKLASTLKDLPKGFAFIEWMIQR